MMMCKIWNIELIEHRNGRSLWQLLTTGTNAGEVSTRMGSSSNSSTVYKTHASSAYLHEQGSAYKPVHLLMLGESGMMVPGKGLGYGVGGRGWRGLHKGGEGKRLPSAALGLSKLASSQQNNYFEWDTPCKSLSCLCSGGIYLRPLQQPLLSAQ